MPPAYAADHGINVLFDQYLRSSGGQLRSVVESIEKSTHELELNEVSERERIQQIASPVNHFHRHYFHQRDHGN